MRDEDVELVATTLLETPGLADASMGPTKLFRAALLREREITFPEGWRQMEDQLFTLRAYLAARCNAARLRAIPSSS